MRVTKRCVAAGFLALLAASCRADPNRAILEQAIKRIEYEPGSVIQYAEVPEGTTLCRPGKGGVESSTALEGSGFVVFIDEQPNYDWEHKFQLVFVPKATGKPQVLFRGNGIPVFAFKKADGTLVKQWSEH
jgi:hypothetical protein